MFSRSCSPAVVEPRAIPLRRGSASAGGRASRDRLCRASGNHGLLSIVPVRQSQVPGGLPGPAGTLSGVPEALPNRPGTLSSVPETASKCPEALSDSSGALSNRPGALFACPETLSNVPGMLFLVPETISSLPTARITPILTDNRGVAGTPLTRPAATLSPQRMRGEGRVRGVRRPARHRSSVRIGISPKTSKNTHLEP